MSEESPRYLNHINPSKWLVHPKSNETPPPLARAITHLVVLWDVMWKNSGMVVESGKTEETCSSATSCTNFFPESTWDWTRSFSMKSTCLTVWVIQVHTSVILELVKRFVYLFIYSFPVFVTLCKKRKLFTALAAIYFTLSLKRKTWRFNSANTKPVPIS